MVLVTICSQSQTLLQHSKVHGWPLLHVLLHGSLHSYRDKQMLPHALVHWWPHFNFLSHGSLHFHSSYLAHGTSCSWPQSDMVLVTTLLHSHMLTEHFNVHGWLLIHVLLQGFSHMLWGKQSSPHVRVHRWLHSNFLSHGSLHFQLSTSWHGMTCLWPHVSIVMSNSTSHLQGSQHWSLHGWSLTHLRVHGL